MKIIETLLWGLYGLMGTCLTVTGLVLTLYIGVRAGARGFEDVLEYAESTLSAGKDEHEDFD